MGAVTRTLPVAAARLPGDGQLRDERPSRGARRIGQIGRRWVLLYAAGAVSTVLAVAFAPTEHRDTVALATVNVFLGAQVPALTWGRGTLRFLVLCSILPGLVISWPLVSLYLVFFFENATYVSGRGAIPLLLDGYRDQLAVFVFLVAYTVACWPTIAKMRAGTARESVLSRRLDTGEWGLTLMAVASAAAGWLAPMLEASDPVIFVANAVRNFFGSLFFVTGLRWRAYTRAQKTVVLLGVGMSGFVNTVANSRGMALLPVVLLVGGFLAAPETRWRARWVIVAGLAATLPIYAVVGNQTRLALGTLGVENFGERADILGEAVAGRLQKEHGGFVNDISVRMFGIGGHELIQSHWNDSAFERLDVDRYLREFSRTLLPAFIFGRPEDPLYTGTTILRDYGFMITEKTSVEVTLIGSLFYAGGLVGVGVGAVILAWINCGVVWMIGRGRERFLNVVVAAAVAYVDLLAFNLDLIQNARSLCWILLYQMVAYVCVFVVVSIQPKVKREA